MIPIPIELVRNLISKGGWPLMIDQWPILIPMNTNTNINTNTNDPNTNRAGEEFDQWRWMTIDQWPNLLGEKVTRERGKKMLTNLMSEKVATKRVNIDIVQADSQKPRQRVSNADRKVFANPESFCDKFIIGWRISGYFAIQNIQIICKVSGWTGKFPDYLNSVRMNWKVSRWCKKCLENLKNVSGYSKKSLDDLKMYLDNLESFWMILKMSGLCKKKVRMS